MASRQTGSFSRRDFTRLFAVGGSAALFAHPAWAQSTRPSRLPAGGPGTGETFWKAVRTQFVMPPGLAVMNAANLCPASVPVIEALTRETKNVDQDPSQQNRARLTGAREDTRKQLATFLGVTPEEIVITRNTSESNNLVSNGLDLKPGDEVVIFGDNHPSNNQAWAEKAKRFGFQRDARHRLIGLDGVGDADQVHAPALWHQYAKFHCHVCVLLFLIENNGDGSVATPLVGVPSYPSTCVMQTGHPQGASLLY